MSCSLQESLFAEKSLTNISVFIPLDAVVAVFSVTANLLCLVTLVKKKSLQTPSNILIAGLCFSDTLVGLLIQPLSISYLAFIRIQKVHNESLLMAVFLFSHALIGLSFTYTTIINIDRYLAICHPFKYTANATRSTHIRIAIATFVISAIGLLLDRFFLWQLIVEVFRITFTAIALLSIIVTNIEVIKVISRQNTAMRSATATANNQTSRGDFRRKRKERSKAYACITATGIFVLCYIPTLVIFFHHIRIGSLCWKSYVHFIINLWASFLINLGSFINPIIYCIRIKSIRKAVKTLFCRKNSDRVSRFIP